MVCVYVRVQCDGAVRGLASESSWLHVWLCWGLGRPYLMECWPLPADLW